MTNLGYSNSYDDSGAYDMYEPEDFSQHIAVGVGIMSFFIAAAVSPLVGVGVALYAMHRYVDKDRLKEEKLERDRLREQQYQHYLSHWRGILEAVPDGEDPPVPRGLSWQDGSMAEYLHLWEEVKGDRKAGKITIPAQLTGKVPAHPDDILPAEFVENLVNRREETGLKGLSVPVSLPDVPQAPKVAPIAPVVNSLNDERRAFKAWIQQWADELLESTAEYKRCNLPKTRNYWARSNMKTVDDFDALMRRILAPNNVIADNWLYLSGKPPIVKASQDAHIAVSESPKNSEQLLEDRLIAFLQGKQNVTLPEIKAAIGEDSMGFLLTLRDCGRLTINKEMKTVTLNG